ncbi:sensor histidine kinase [Actinacidiphila bryophytorum]|uniref:sensor histidine kinase n=1 Tax=Actinacidiphila bryophytorum TaxID=1436133 RepID=UPI002176EC59|nr:HAMP domain-containing sensor histidine kinase [Actinacidiphila bryophytorum]UWE09772.1 HAMP domain-containing histidine kinase [Actinacidiphila bryophytorum]
MGVRLRTTLAATAVVAAALALAAVALFSALHASLTDSANALAAQDADRKAAVVQTEQQGPGTGGTVSGLPASPGAPQDPAGGLPAPPPGGPPEGGALVVISRQVTTGSGTVTVKGTASLAPARAAMRTLTAVLVPGIPALLVLVAVLTWLAVGRALRPVSAIRAKVADITARDLHERVPEPASRDEIGALARTVNATLDRLQTAVGAHRQFVADAAHELRSPMAVLRTRLELARPAERRLAADALDDVQRLQTLTADLLLLARLDAREPIRTRETDLAQIVAEEAARARPRTDVQVALWLTPDLLVDGSPDHLRRLVANLVDNAVRHAAGSVTVALTEEAGSGQARLEVADDGPGIPPEHQATVFDRFTRLDHARTRDTGGSGLGLSIARDIALAHHATLQVVPGAGPGARLRAVFPLRAPARC